MLGGAPKMRGMRKPILKTGVYYIRNDRTGDFYIGSAAKGFRPRWWNHRSHLRGQWHDNSRLQRAWNKYGEAAFTFGILEPCTPEECIEREQYYIDLLSPPYNLAPTAGSTLGYKHTEEDKKKMRGRVWTKEARERVGAVARGRSMHPNTREALAKRLANQNQSEETKKKRSKSIKAWWATRGEWHHSEETKRKIHHALLGKAKNISPEGRARILQSHLGKKLSLATRAKISVSRLLYLARKKEQEKNNLDNPAKDANVVPT
jgi:group I intron endonuclease